MGSTAFAVTIAGGIITHLTVCAAIRHRPVIDGAAWLHAQQRRSETYAAFARTADEIGTVARPGQQETACAHLWALELREGLVALGSGHEMAFAAGQLVAKCRRLFDGLDVDAPSGPATPTPMLMVAFLVACRMHLEAEEAQHLGIRPARHVLFARLSARSRGDVTRPELGSRVTSPPLASCPGPRHRVLITATMTVPRALMMAAMMMLMSSPSPETLCCVGARLCHVAGPLALLNIAGQPGVFTVSGAGSARWRNTESAAVSA
ncbi:hypothetical protein [Streptomyces bobili]|uniref:hypothetical protein n=1 Tax=Streptomyces bobili TaxID=67280 RepID=UPI0037BA97D6